MKFGKFLRNRIKLELTSAAPEISLDEISRHNIGLYHVHITGELTVCFEIYYADYSALEKLCERRGEKIHIIGKSGYIWYLLAAGKRPVLLLGLILFLIASLWIPRFIFFVQVEGNTTVSDQFILEAAEACGISFGADRKTIRSEKVKNALLEKLPQLQWAGVNTRGCVAIISVREKPKEETENTEFAVYSIVAARDGIITSCTALQGNLLCKEGQAVSRGETLISPYTDCGLSILVSTADGEVYAQTERKLEAKLPRNWSVQQSETTLQRCFGILIGKKRINLWKDSGIWDGTCDRMYQEYYMVLPGGYKLPVGIWIQTVTTYQLVQQPMDESAAEEYVKEHIYQSLSRQMTAGQVLQPQEQFSVLDDCYTFEGNYVCSEMIGVPKPEKIGEYYGKTN